jgi:hypothetical protein
LQATTDRHIGYFNRRKEAEQEEEEEEEWYPPTPPIYDVTEKETLKLCLTSICFIDL